MSTHPDDSMSPLGHIRSRSRLKLALLMVTLVIAGGLATAWRITTLSNQERLAAASSSAALASRDAPPGNSRPNAADQGAPGLAATAAAAPSAVAAGTQPNAASDAGAGTSASPEATKPVVLTVQSNLPGALVTKDGFQVCDQTPCTVEVPRGAAVELIGVKGYARGVAKVLAQQDQTVSLVLVHAKPGAKKKDSGKPGLCEVTVDGLKILRPCE